MLFSKKRILFIGGVIFILSILIICVDMFVIKKNSFLYIDNYESIVTTVWSIQVTLSTLAIAFLSLFINRLDDVYYGLTVKKLLGINKIKFTANYYELIFLTILINGMSAFSVVSNSLNAIIILLFIQLYIITNILSTSLRISMDDSFAKDISKKYVEGLLEHVSTINIDKISESDEIKQNQLIDIIKFIVKKKSECNRVIFENDRDLMFIISIMRECRNSNDGILKICNNELLSLFYDLIRKQEYNTAYDIATWLIHSDNKYESREIINNFCYLYYKRNLDEGLFNQFLDYMKPNLTQSLDEYLDIGLELVLKICLYSDKNNFTESLRCACNFNEDTLQQIVLKAEFFHAIAGYLYYLGLKEPYYIDQYGEERHHNIKGLISGIFSRNANNISCSSILKNESFLVGTNKCQQLADFKNKNINYQTLIEFGQARTVHICGDIDEYSIFMIYSLYTNDITLFENLKYEFLIKLRKSLSYNGELADCYSINYCKFCEWIGWDKIDSNYSLVNDLTEYIKNRALELVKENRSDKISRTNKILKLQSDLFSICEKTPFYTNDGDVSRMFERYSIEDINSYSRKITYVGLDKLISKEMLATLYCINEKHMKKLSYNILSNPSEIQQLQFLETLKDNLEHNDLSVNFNENVEKFFRYRNFEPEIVKKILQVSEKIQHLDFHWDIGKYAMIYINEKCFMPQIRLDETFVEEVSFLEDQEVKDFIMENCYYENKYHIRISHDLELECSKEECYEFVKQSKFKLKFKFYLSEAKDDFGVVIYLSE